MNINVKIFYHAEIKRRNDKRIKKNIHKNTGNVEETVIRLHECIEK